VNDIKKLTGR
jgi:hypothetical protein